jgi:hypothetical protein
MIAKDSSNCDVMCWLFWDATIFCNILQDWILNPDILNQYGESGPTKACAWSGDDVTPAGIPPSCNK